MYIYDLKLSGAQYLRKEEPINSTTGVRNSQYHDPGASTFGRAVGTGGSYVSANEGLGEPAARQAGLKEVRTLQESLNKWRVVKGDTPIKVDGFFGPDTKSAVQEFQKASGLTRQDGIVDKTTQQRLTVLLAILKGIPDSPMFSVERIRLVGLVGGPGFGSLDLTTQNEVLSRILSYGKPGTLDNVRFLTDLVTQSGFELLRPSIKKLMLSTLAARPSDGALADTLAQLASSQGFRFEEPMQLWVINRIKAYGGSRDRIDNLENLITASFRFDQLSRANRNLMLTALANHPRDVVLANNFSRAADRTDFRRLNQPTQTEVLTRILNYPRDVRNVDNLMSLMITPAFRNLWAGVRGQILDGLPSRFGNVDLDPVMIGNLMTMVTALGFDKLRPEVRDLMLDLQAARPTNAQLANDLGNLALGPRLHDRRIANKTIMQVNDSIP